MTHVCMLGQGGLKGFHLGSLSSGGMLGFIWDHIILLLSLAGAGESSCGPSPFRAHKQTAGGLSLCSLEVAFSGPPQGSAPAAPTSVQGVAVHAWLHKLHQFSCYSGAAKQGPSPVLSTEAPHIRKGGGYQVGMVTNHPHLATILWYVQGRCLV